MHLEIHVHWCFFNVLGMEKAAEMYTKGFCMIARRQLSMYISFIVFSIAYHYKIFLKLTANIYRKTLYIELFTTYLLIVTHSP